MGARKNGGGGEEGVSCGGVEEVVCLCCLRRCLQLCRHTAKERATARAGGDRTTPIHTNSISKVKK